MGIHIHNLYCDANGESHWRDIEVDWAEENEAGKLSARETAYGIIFRQTQAEHDRPWHPAPRRQYIVNLDAGVQLTASDGEARTIGAGEIMGNPIFKVRPHNSLRYWLDHSNPCPLPPRRRAATSPAIPGSRTAAGR